MMIRIAARTARRSWRQLVATVLAVGLAVGLIAGSVQFAVHAQQTLGGSGSEVPAGPGVVTVAGPGAGFDDTAVASIRQEPGVAAVVPTVTVAVTLVAADGAPVTGLVGRSPTLVPWSAQPAADTGRLTGGREPRGPGELVLSQDAAARSGLAVGDRAAIVSGTGVRRLLVVGIAAPGGNALASGPWVAAAPATVAAVGAFASGWPAMLVQPSPGTTSTALADRLALLGPDVGVITVADTRRQLSAESTEVAGGLGGALGTFAVVGLFVGLFVISGALRALSRQRVRQLALLRAVGAGPRQVRRVIRVEALLVGLAGSVLGVPLAMGVAAVSGSLLAEEGLDTGPAAVRPGLLVVLTSVVAGVVVCQLAAWRAGRDAARTSPLAVLRDVHADGSGRSWSRLVMAVLLLAGAGGAYYGATVAGHSDSPTAALGAGSAALSAGLLGITALAVLGPFLVAPAGRLLAAAARPRPCAAWLAGAHTARGPARVASSAAVLMVSVALLTCGAALLSSGQDAVSAQAGRSVTATLAVVPADRSDDSPGLPADLPERVERAAGVSATGLYDTRVPLADAASDGIPVEVTGVEPSSLAGVLTFDVTGAPLAALGEGDVAVEASSARTRGWRVGQSLQVQGPDGAATLSVSTIYTDPARVLGGSAITDRRTAVALNRSAGVRAVLVGGGDNPAAGAWVRAALTDVPTAVTLDRTAYLARIGDTAIGGENLIVGFLGMAVGVAVVGLAVMLSLSVTERTPQLGLLRAVGALPGQLRSMLRWEAAITVLLGVGLGVGTGLVTVLLVGAAARSDVIGAQLDPMWWILLPTGAAVVALAASLSPARRAARSSILDAVAAQ